MKGKSLQKKIAYVLSLALVLTSMYTGDFAYADEGTVETKPLSGAMDLTNVTQKTKYVPNDTDSKAIENGEAYIQYDPANKELTIKNIYYRGAQIKLPKEKVTVKLEGKNMLYNVPATGAEAVFKQGADIDFNASTPHQFNEESGITFTGDGSLNIFSKVKVGNNVRRSIETDGYLIVENGKLYTDIEEVTEFEKSKSINEHPAKGDFAIVCDSYKQTGGDVIISNTDEVSSMKTFAFTLTGGKFGTVKGNNYIAVYGNLIVTGGQFMPSFTGIAHAMVRGDVKIAGANDGVIVYDYTMDSLSHVTLKHFRVYGNAEMSEYDGGSKKIIPGDDTLIKLGLEGAQTKLEIKEGATLNIRNGQVLACVLYSKGGGEEKTEKIENVVKNNGKIVNDGKFEMQLGESTKEAVDKKVKEIADYLKMEGIGTIVAKDKEDHEYVYNNDGNPRKTVANGTNLDFSAATENVATADNGITWEKETAKLTLDGVYLNDTQNITLPTDKKVTIELKGSSVLGGALVAADGHAFDITISGKGKLIMRKLPDAVANNDTVTIAGGAKVYVKETVTYGGSGAEDSFLNVKGQGTLLDIDATNVIGSKATSLQDIKVMDGAELSIHGKGISAYVQQGNINVSKNSKLKVACQYGVYVYNGKLTVDDSSTLETDATSAGIVVVNSDVNKKQEDVLRLPGTPSGTHIAEVTANSHKFWTVANVGSTVAVVGTESNPADNITGALGKLTIKKATATGGGGSHRNKDEIKPDAKNDDGKKFDDVNKDDWYYNSVDFVDDKGYMKGIAPRKFGPMLSTSRSTISQIVYNLEKKPGTTAKHDFTDVPVGAWYEPSLNFTFDKNVIIGFPDKTFRGNDIITREQLAKVLYQYAQYKGYDSATDANVSAYEAFNKVGDWAKPSIQWAIKHNVMKGRTNTRLEPKAVLTRAELAEVLKNFHTEFVK